MTEHLDDDALSASLDDEATPEERAHLELCPACRARAAQLRAAAMALAVPPAIDPARREAAIAAALPATRRRLPSWVLPAAAAVLVLGAMVPLLTHTTANDNSRKASSNEAFSSATTTSMAASGSAAAPRASSGAADASSEPVIDATTFPAFAQSVLRQGSSSATATGPGCEGAVRTRATVGDLRGVGRALVGGQPAEVLVFATAGDGSEAFAVAPGGCQDLLAPVMLR